MARPTDLPQWADDPGADVVEPSGFVKALGWEAGVAPPASYFNWAQNQYYLWLQHLDKHTRKSHEQIALGNWTRHTPFAVTDDLNAVAVNADASVVMMVGDGGQIETMNLTADLNSVAADAAYAGNFNAVVFDPIVGGFVACGDAEQIQTSPTGAVWTSQVGPAADDLNCAAASGAGMVVVAGDTGQIYSGATLGTVDTPRTSAFATSAMYGAAYGAGVFVLVGAAGKIQYSVDGMTGWTSAVNAGGADFIAVSYDPFLGFVALRSTHIYTSTDGITWAAHAYTPPATTLKTILALETGAYIFQQGASAVSSIFGVYDPFTSTGYTQPRVVEELINGVCLGPNRVVYAVGENGLILTSAPILSSSD